MIQSTSNRVVTQRWYVELAYNNNNSPAYVDMVKDMERMGNGVFTCIFKINDGNICDYLVIENDTYVNFTPPKTN